MLSSQKIKIYQELLEKEKEKLLRILSSEESPENFGEDTEDEDEEADEAAAFGNQLALAQVTKNRINEIDAALNKIEIGDYGVCTKCRKEISENLLRIVPESQLCEDCKKIS
jgi:DnaK suppressor protein